MVRSRERSIPSEERHQSQDTYLERGVATPVDQSEFSVIDCIVHETGESRAEAARRMVDLFVVMHAIMRGLGVTSAHDEKFRINAVRMWSIIGTDEEILNALKHRGIKTLDSLLEFVQDPMDTEA